MPTLSSKFGLLCLSLLLCSPALGEGGGRKSKSDQAVMTAMIGAIGSGISCLAKLRAARQMPPGPEKQKLQAEAMKECAQSAKNAQNAGQNQGGSDQLSAPQANSANPLARNTPEEKKAEKENKPLTFPNAREQAKNETNLVEPSLLSPVEIEEGSSGSELPAEGTDFATTELFDDSVFDSSSGLGDISFADVGNSPTQKTAPQPLRPIAPNEIGFDEGAAPGGARAPTPPTLRAPASNTLSLGKSKLTLDSQRELAEALDGLQKKAALAAVGKLGNTSSFGAPASETPSLSSLMDGFMGKRKSKNAGSQGQVLNLSGAQKKKNPGKRMNIFSYGSFRLKELAYKKQRIRPKLIVRTR